MQRTHLWRRGSTTIQLALSLTSILGVGALVVDIGYARLVHVQLQGAVDAAAHAGVSYLDGTDVGMELAVDGAVAFGALNFADGQPVDLDPDTQIELGVWDGVEFLVSADPEEVNAVRVVAGAEGLETWFAGAAFGRTELATNATAIAVMPPREPAGALECYIPLAVPDCLFDKSPDQQIIDVDLELNSDKNDTAGWALVGDDPSSASAIRDHMENCSQDGEIELMDVARLNNGTLTSTLRALADEIIASETTFDETTFGPIGDPYEKSDVDKAGAYGRSFEGPLIVFDGGDDCDNVTYNQSRDITGFVWGSVYDVQSTGAVASKNIAVRLDVAHEYDDGTAGGGTLEQGIGYQPPIMLVY